MGPFLLCSITSFFQSIIETAQQKDKQDMLTELEIMKSMRPHPHVVRLIGCCTDKGTGLIETMNLQFSSF